MKSTLRSVALTAMTTSVQRAQAPYITRRPASEDPLRAARHVAIGDRRRSQAAKSIGMRSAIWCAKREKAVNIRAGPIRASEPNAEHRTKVAGTGATRTKDVNIDLVSSCQRVFGMRKRNPHWRFAAAKHPGGLGFAPFHYHPVPAPDLGTWRAFQWTHFKSITKIA